ncbi:hypothetical protein P5G51_005205 [Virgibacillus sp. 179-BFC.A HS]|uniref:Uncharacterized protein n=1 Tax=Tigheibacillus jepli TaxID=3035914 RepID=A0ABU5CH64_9BACI|nr:hypothetical protein [Virgibacillus sp. 179-BFC.A HS]MDY0404875.1 hypothetical protein [Virgibacillus sp. 179-BFC.A HS]
MNTRFMKDTIDKHVRSIELNINNLAIDLKKQSVAAIGKAADAKVDAAKKSLDDIVSGIK